MKKFIITESEKKEIRSLYGLIIEEIFSKTQNVLNPITRY